MPEGGSGTAGAPVACCPFAAPRIAGRFSASCLGGLRSGQASAACMTGCWQFFLGCQ